MERNSLTIRSERADTETRRYRPKVPDTQRPHHTPPQSVYCDWSSPVCSSDHATASPYDPKERILKQPESEPVFGRFGASPYDPKERILKRCTITGSAWRGIASPYDPKERILKRRADPARHADHASLTIRSERADTETMRLRRDLVGQGRASPYDPKERILKLIGGDIDANPCPSLTIRSERADTETRAAAFCASTQPGASPYDPKERILKRSG